MRITKNGIVKGQIGMEKFSRKKWKEKKCI